jgi:hypothetical protein
MAVEDAYKAFQGCGGCVGKLGSLLSDCGSTLSSLWNAIGLQKGLSIIFSGLNAFTVLSWTVT